MKMNKPSDEWQTPQWLYDELNSEFNFRVDLCATAYNTKIHTYYKNYLTNEIGFLNVYLTKYTPIQPLSSLVLTYGEPVAVFMNPPYSNPLPFVQKAWEDSKFCKIVMLLPVRTSTKWWKVFWDYEVRKGKQGTEVRFLPKRVAFVRDGKEVKGTSFDSCIIIMDRRNT